MKAKKVYEFERGEDINKSLSIGEYAPFKDGDKIRTTKDIKTKINGATILAGTYLIFQEETQFNFAILFEIGHRERIIRYVFDEYSPMSLDEFIKSDSWKRVISTNESVEFKRHKDINKSLSIGKYAPFKEGDRIRITRNFTPMNASGGMELKIGTVYRYVEETKHTYASFMDVSYIYSAPNFFSDKFLKAENMLIHENGWERVGNTNESMNFERGKGLTKALDVGNKRSELWDQFDWVIDLTNGQRIALVEESFPDHDGTSIYVWRLVDEEGIKTETSKAITDEYLALMNREDREQIVQEMDDTNGYNDAEANRGRFNESVEFKKHKDITKSLDIGLKKTNYRLLYYKNGNQTAQKVLYDVTLKEAQYEVISHLKMYYQPDYDNWATISNNQQVGFRKETWNEIERLEFKNGKTLIADTKDSVRVDWKPYYTDNES